MVSVVVPVFNVEKYLKKCIESIIHQSYKNLEILIIDDGSSDRSPAICDSFLFDNRVKVFHIENRGVASARNFGIENATGKYIFFLDGDVFLELDCIEQMVRQMKTNCCDLVICGTILEYEDGQKKKKQSQIIPKVIDNEEYLKNLLLEKAEGGTVVWNKLFKKENVKKPFPKLAIREDFIFLLENLDANHKIVTIETCLYHYVQRKGSARISKFDITSFDSIKCADMVVEFVKKKYIAFQKYAYILQYNYYMGTLSRMLYWNVENEYCEEKKEIETYVKMLFPKVKEMREMSKVKKYSYWMYFHCENLYTMAIKLYYNLTLYKTR